MTIRAGGFLLTRGLGGNPTHVLVQGFLPVIEEEIKKVGGKFVRREKQKKYDEENDRFYEEYNIYVELTAVNGKDLFEPIINKVKHKISDKNISISVQPKKLSVQSPDIKINVKVVEKNNVND